jgi:hypothetical protein
MEGRDRCLGLKGRSVAAGGRVGPKPDRAVKAALARPEGVALTARHGDAGSFKAVW